MKIQIHITLSLVNCGTASNGDDEFCYCNTCSENEGDCDSHDECQDGLACGSNNCPVSLGFDSEVDCCYLAVECAYSFILAPSCKDCGVGYEYIYENYPDSYSDGDLCTGADCYWNFDLGECQPKGNSIYK